jgi:glutaredoxin
MKTLNELTNDTILQSIKKGEFPDDILSQAETVIVVMTQDWCPQWIFMKKWLHKFNNENCKVFQIIYNNKDYGEKFMKFKEEVFENNLVPYVRIYKNKKFFKDCNYRSENMFKQFLNS